MASQHPTWSTRTRPLPASPLSSIPRPHSKSSIIAFAADADDEPLSFSASSPPGHRHSLDYDVSSADLIADDFCSDDDCSDCSGGSSSSLPFDPCNEILALQDFELTPSRLLAASGETTLDAIQKLTLSDIDCATTPLYDLGSLAPNLRSLRLTSSCVVPSFRDFGTRLSNLRVLWLVRCGVSDLSGIDSLPLLAELYLSFNDVSSLADLCCNDVLEILDVEANLVPDVREVRHLKDCKELTTVTLVGCPVQTAYGDDDKSYRRDIASALGVDKREGTITLDDEPLDDDDDEIYLKSAAVAPSPDPSRSIAPPPSSSSPYLNRAAPTSSRSTPPATPSPRPSSADPQAPLDEGLLVSAAVKLRAGAEGDSSRPSSGNNGRCSSSSSSRKVSTPPASTPSQAGRPPSSKPWSAGRSAGRDTPPRTPVSDARSPSGTSRFSVSSDPRRARPGSARSYFGRPAPPSNSYDDDLLSLLRLGNLSVAASTDASLFSPSSGSCGAPGGGNGRSKTSSDLTYGVGGVVLSGNAAVGLRMVLARDRFGGPEGGQTNDRRAAAETDAGSFGDGYSGSSEEFGVASGGRRASAGGDARSGQLAAQSPALQDKPVAYEVAGDKESFKEAIADLKSWRLARAKGGWDPQSERGGDRPSGPGASSKVLTSSLSQHPLSSPVPCSSPMPRGGTLLNVVDIHPDADGTTGLGAAALFRYRPGTAPPAAVAEAYSARRALSKSSRGQGVLASEACAPGFEPSSVLSDLDDSFAFCPPSASRLPSARRDVDTPSSDSVCSPSPIPSPRSFGAGMASAEDGDFSFCFVGDGGSEAAPTTATKATKTTKTKTKTTTWGGAVPSSSVSGKPSRQPPSSLGNAPPHSSSLPGGVGSNTTASSNPCSVLDGCSSDEESRFASSKSQQQQQHSLPSSIIVSSSPSPRSAHGLPTSTIVSLLRQRPKDVKELRTRHAFRAFFKGVERGTLRELLREAYEGLEEGEREEKVEKRIRLMDDE